MNVKYSKNYHIWNSFCIHLYVLSVYFIFERERERESEQTGEGQRENETQDLKWALC